MLVSAALLGAIACAAAGAQVGGRAADGAGTRALENHVPEWANAANLVETVPPDHAMGPMTLVLERHADREKAFESLLADQQDPSSPQYHRWLTASEIGERFGLSTDELDALSTWLESQGLRVDWVAPGRNFIGFSGSAGDVSRAFQSELNYYNVKGERKFSIASAPQLPGAVAPMVKAVRGLSTIDEHPMHQVRPRRIPQAPEASPEVTLQTGENFIAPADFAVIYDVGNTYLGKGVTIGIVAEARTDAADFDNFKQQIGDSFSNPTEVIPTAFGGVDPGPPYTSPPADPSDSGAQSEATLDVLRSATIAQEAKVLVVASTASSGGIGTDAQYLVQSEPVPAQIMSISWGLCESEATASGVDFWDALFKQGAGEGISIFVSSGDSGASGCDASFTTPPTDPAPNSPNSICSSSYATCVGGTEFNDASDYSKYWTTNNGPGFLSALSYIPEGAWNEPLNSNDQPVVAASGGGVSRVIATPSWQTVKGVPSAKAGRYTPDVAFSASGHDGYFGCFAAGDGSCVSNAQGEFGFVIWSGTSAAAPDMAGIAALLDQKEGKGQGNLNPALYALAVSAPQVFHDVTVASSGVSGCSVSTPSMCNNSIAGPNGLSGGQAGFLVGTGYDEVTGLGSLDVNQFLAKYVPVGGGGGGGKPTAVTGKASAVTAAGATLAGTVNPNGEQTQYYFYYGKSSTLAGAAKTAVKTATGSTAVAVTANIAGLAPKTTYYFELSASNSSGASIGSIASFVTPKASQTITVKQPASPIVYGVKPIAISAKATSGLPVKLTLLLGHAKISGSTLTITGPGKVTVAANQAGNADYLAATEVKLSFTVDPAPLKAIAKNETMTQGGAVPALAYSFSGFVNGDTQATAVKGVPALSTTATSNSTAGPYPITIKAGTLSASKYTFKFVNGTMTVDQ